MSKPPIYIAEDGGESIRASAGERERARNPLELMTLFNVDDGRSKWIEPSI